MNQFLIPMSGQSLYEVSEHFKYPKILTEVNGKTLLEYSLECFSSVNTEKKLLMVIPKTINDELDIAKIINLVISPNEIQSVIIEKETLGAACSCLMAVDKLELDQPLIISSADHYFSSGLDEAINYFKDSNCDAGVITFESLHPKWSYVELDSNHKVVSAAEKKVISKTALAGMFYFKEASLFIDAAKDMVTKGASINGLFFVAPVLNELVLLGKDVITYSINKHEYHNFYDIHAVNEFSQYLRADSEVRLLAEKYIDAFNTKNIDIVKELFEDSASLKDPDIYLVGKNNITSYIGKLFETNADLNFKSKNISVVNNKSIIEFSLVLSGISYEGVDIIYWKYGKIVSLNAYLNEVL
jgi:NDP-sugar pyrophosphorylase family protein